MESLEGKEHGCGKCFFCLSRCPDCKSTEIDVRYEVEYGYTNDTEGCITVGLDWSQLRLTCKSCGQEFQKGDDKSLELLEHEMEKLLELPHNRVCEMNGGQGKVYESSFTVRELTEEESQTLLGHSGFAEEV